MILPEELCDNLIISYVCVISVSFYEGLCMHCKVNIAFVSVWMRNFWKMLENASVDETSFFKSIWNDVG